MKFICIFCLLLILILSCRKDEVPLLLTCESEITSYSENYFTNDAIELALDRTLEDSLSPFQNSPQIDENLVHSIMGKLSAIFSEADDSTSEFYNLIYYYKIHSRPKWTFNDISVKFNDSLLENEFITNPALTSSPELNAITTTYGFTLTNTMYGFYFLHSNFNYNIPVLCDKLKSDSRIAHASPNYFCCDGNDITYNHTTTYDEFIFDYGMGDCPSGCFGHHFWRIHVDKDCNVSMIEEFGDPLPE